jgi:arylsulfatase A-like enzyme/tetratricopeptide (TPR) repeat protein
LKQIIQLTIFVALLIADARAATTRARKSSQAHKSTINVILITMDTLRADHVSCYGAKQVRTPALDSLCRDGTVFEHAFAQVPLTWPSHAAILTGTYPFQNGVQDFTGQPLSEQFHTVTQGFKHHGYATGAVVSAFVLDRSWGLSRSFDFYDDAFSAETFKKKDIGLVDRKAEESVSHAIAWLKKAPHHPFFLWLHLYDPHSPYDPPEPYFTQHRDHLYDGEIAYADHELERLLDWLKRNQLYDRSLIVFLSDHGESLGEHGEGEHGFFIYNATVRVPLIVKPPAASGFKPGRVSAAVETIAVAPTLFHLAGLKDAVAKQFQSSSLFDRQPRNEPGAYSETFYPFSSFGWSPLHGLETSRYHYIDAPTPELYDVIADPEEKDNLAPKQPATVAVLKEKLQRVLNSNRLPEPQSGASELGPDAAAKLRALGYVAYRSPVSAAALARGLADPKDKLEEFNAILKAGDAFYAGDFQASQQLLAGVQEKDPQMYIVPFMLGEAALRQQKWDAASTQLQHCLELNPNFDQAMTALAHAFVMQSKPVEARRWIEKALAYNPKNYRAWYELGLLESKLDRASAMTAYRKAVSIQPNFAASRRELGLLCYEEKNYSEAAEHLSKAIALGTESTLVYNDLGISYSQTGRLQKAIESYHQALRLEPNLAQAHLNLAYAYQQLHRAGEAQAEYQSACKLQEKFCRFVPKVQ